MALLTQISKPTKKLAESAGSCDRSPCDTQSLRGAGFSVIQLNLCQVDVSFSSSIIYCDCLDLSQASGVTRLQSFNLHSLCCANTLDPNPSPGNIELQFELFWSLVMSFSNQFRCRHMKNFKKLNKYRMDLSQTVL